MQLFKLQQCLYCYIHTTQAALNEAGYSVWIDEAGIRAGHKWRNEIADGIQVLSLTK